MDKAKLVDLKKKLYIRSALIALGSIDEILGINDSYTSDEILLEIIKKALREFENTVPLILEMKMNRGQMRTCYDMPGFFEIKSNFTLYLDCAISEDQIVLVPNSIPMWRVGGYTWPAAGAYQYVSDYRRPYVFLGDLPGNEIFYLRGICSRPIIPDFTADKHFNTEGCGAIYWMNIEEGSKGNFFVDLCMCHLLDYVRQLKASVQLPALSIDIMGNVDPAFQELRARCDNYIQQSGWYGELVI